METLNNENRSLRDELKRLSEECEKVTSENNTIKVFQCPFSFLCKTPDSRLSFLSDNCVQLDP